MKRKGSKICTTNFLSLLVGLGYFLQVLLSSQPSAGASQLAVNLNPLTQITSQDPTPPGMVWGFDEIYMQTNGMIGWDFSLSRPVTVTGLAWFAQNTNGLSHPHEVGIWSIQNENAQLLASVGNVAQHSACFCSALLR